MGMATLLGGLTAFPINYWLVKRKLKHGCMTLTEKPSHSDKEKTHDKHSHHAMSSLPFKTQLAYIGISFGILLFIVGITGIFIPLSI